MVGAQRSGTTLVRLVLDAHPAISIGPESSFLKNIADGVARATATDRARKRQDTFDVSAEEIESELGAAWGRVLALHARRRGATRWGDKSPVHRYHGERIHRLFPGSQLVVVVRHPAAVARSRGEWGYDLDKTARDWGATIRHHRADAARFGARRFHLVRYEDLLAHPREVLADLLAFLGEPWDDVVLDHASQHDDGTMTDGGTVMSDPLDPSRAMAWLDEIDDDDLATIAAAAGEEMALVGYAADRAAPVLPLPRNELTEAPAPRSRTAVLQAALRQRGVVGLLRRGVAEVRRRGMRDAVMRWRHLG